MSAGGEEIVNKKRTVFFSETVLNKVLTAWLFFLFWGKTILTAISLKVEVFSNPPSYLFPVVLLFKSIAI